jgi:ribosomal protein S18 acetylase RimI-like enzyme
MSRDEISIRRYRPGDLDDLYRICLLTADSGQDATSLYRDPLLPGQVFAAPYGLFEPELAFVATDAAGVGGYILGALDSHAFERSLERDWWPQLRERYPEPPPAAAEQPQTADQQMACLIHHPLHAPDELAGRYPSHLHIDLLPRLQGRGQGRLLMSRLTAELRRLGSPGVHLHVTPDNHRAAAFYLHLGFSRLSVTGARVFGLELAG